MLQNPSFFCKIAWLMVVLMQSEGVNRAVDKEPANVVSQGLEAVQKGLEALHSCGLQSPPLLTRVFFTNRSITCNDGSTAGYYIRRSHGSRRWIVYLEGGWYCFDVRSCINRWSRMRSLMTSRLWPEIKQVGGILSADPEENPYWWNANHVFVPYCSSDSWSGSAFPKSSDHLAFLGAEIVLQVIRELLPHGLMHARRLYLVGSSAGGTGVIINLDRVADFLREAGSSTDVRGIADSGWFLDNEPFSPRGCTDSDTCAPVEAVKLGIKLWNGQIPERCRSQYSSNELWKCYFGYRVYPTLKTPLFIFQWLFDEAQMTADNVGAPVTKSQWDYIHRMGDILRTTLRNVTAVFAPSCISHIILTKRDWKNVIVNTVSLPQAIRCWEDHEPGTVSQQTTTHGESSTNSSEMRMLADLPWHRAHKRFRNHSSDGGHSQKTSNQHSRGKKNRRRNRRKHKDRKEDSAIDQQGGAQNSARCSLRLLDECTWPQCNRACPKLHNPFTGEEMDFIELLKSFGLDMKSVATALGLDLETLQTMSNDHLLQILTQNTSK